MRSRFYHQAALQNPVMVKPSHCSAAVDCVVAALISSNQHTTHSS
jgi:hypothetical protein